MHQQLQNPKQDKVRRLLLDVAETYGLEITEEIEKIEVKYLGTYVNAQTRSDGGRIRVDFDSHNFFDNTEERKRRIILHELIHVKQITNTLSEWARQEFDISDDAAEKLDGTIWEDVKSIEGETELILSKLFPEQESSYPYAKSSKEKEFSDIDLDMNIEKDIDNLIDEYKIKEDSWEDGELYIERGEFKNERYTVAMLTEDETNIEDKINSYLVQKTEYNSYN